MAVIARRREGEHTVSDRSLGRLLPQTMGHYLWAPMLSMGFMSLVVALVLAVVRSQMAVDLSEGFTGLKKANVETVGQLIPGFMFLGFGFILAGVSLTIARILGVLRSGGGSVQEAVGGRVKTPVMPWTAWVFLMFMMTGTMTLIFAFAGHIYAAVQAHGAWINATSLGGADLPFLGRAETWGAWMEGTRRLGVALLLFGIGHAMATIIRVLRFQSVRVNELAEEKTHPHAS